MTGSSTLLLYLRATYHRGQLSSFSLEMHLNDNDKFSFEEGICARISFFLKIKREEGNDWLYRLIRDFQNSTFIVSFTS